MSVELYRQQVKNIASGLAEVDEEHSASFLANAGLYDQKLEALQVEQEEVQALTEGESAILFHCAYDYVTMDFWIQCDECSFHSQNGGKKQTDTGQTFGQSVCIVGCIDRHAFDKMGRDIDN